MKESSRMRAEVCHEDMSVLAEAGKSYPLSTIQPTLLESGGGEKRRAPRAEKVPAPPRDVVK